MEKKRRVVQTIKPSKTNENVFMKKENIIL